jgi:hypothetical protein
MTTIKEILLKKIEDYKKAQLLQTILLEQGFKCFVEVDSIFVRIEELDNNISLTDKKLSEILELNHIQSAKIRTEIGMYNVFYIPIPC